MNLTYFLTFAIQLGGEAGFPGDPRVRLRVSSTPASFGGSVRGKGTLTAGAPVWGLERSEHLRRLHGFHLRTSQNASLYSSPTLTQLPLVLAVSRG